MLLLNLHHSRLLDPLDFLDSLNSPVLRVRTQPGARQWHRVSLVSLRLHVDVAHIVFFLSNCATVVL